MIIRALIVTAALTIGFAGAAHGIKVLEQPEDAYELALGEVSLPRGAAGTVIFKACADCKTKALRVTALTIYQVNRRTVTLEDLRKAADGYRKMQGGAAKTAVYVYYNIESQRVTRLALDYLG